VHDARLEGIVMIDNRIEIVFSFDTTGSMYPCLAQVRRTVHATVARLAKEIPGIRIGIIAHGDYCDAGSTYVTKALTLTDDVDAVARFVEKVGPTGGGDAPECYELVLHEARGFGWTPGYKQALVLIGDDVPHGPAQNPKKLDWRTELDALGAAGVTVYGVQCLNRRHATPFYQELARKSGGFHVALDQFAHVTDMLVAVRLNQGGGAEAVERFEAEVRADGRMNRGVDGIFNAILRRTRSAAYEPTDLRAVPPGRFQVLSVDRAMVIKDFVLENGLTFKTGRGFYEFTKTETIQGNKEVVLMDRGTGDLFSGEQAREMLGLPPGATVRVKPASLEKYAVFVQSTSYNRKLTSGTRFLYEVEDWDRAAA
jgi:hypothetical protein